MRILITGVGGFVGKHLSNYILETFAGAEIHGTILEGLPAVDNPAITCHFIDLKREDSVFELINQIRPEQIYHLAAQASPKRSFVEPWETLDNNIHSQLNIIQACLKNNIKPRTLIISSAEIYGPVRPEQMPVGENMPFKPTNPYGVSKVAQDMLGLQYFLSHQFPILRVRPFNHTGPGQSEGFVAVDFALQIARIETGKQPPIMEVGNLSAQRDFCDVRDVVRAYGLLMERGEAGGVYNVASGKAYSIQSLLDILLGYSNARIEVRHDPARMMPIDVPVIQGDASLLQKTTGWQPTIPFEQTLLDVLNDCRERVQKS